MDIMVSVYCLVYNHEKYLRKTLDGFVCQKTSFSYEVIIHDDASTDRSADIIKEYCEKYPGLFVTIFQKENQYSKGGGIFSKYIKNSFCDCNFDYCLRINVFEKKEKK